MSGRTGLDVPAQDWRRIRFGLERIAALLELAGNPQQRMRFVHITGTNGKGSTACFIASVLTHAGYRTGLFTSPHIQRFSERIQIDGAEITKSELARWEQKLRGWAAEMPNRPTEFELYTAMGLCCFAERGCEVAVLEVGMGGEFDATNIVQNTDVAVFTNIGLDHTAYLGSTTLEIAATKAGILKPGCRAVIYQQDEAVVSLLRQRAAALGCESVVADFSAIQPQQEQLRGQRFLFEGKSYQIALCGEHQLKNAATALTACRQLQQLGYHITEKNLAEGLAAARWPVRFELVGEKPLFFIDGGHNPQCAEAMAAMIRRLLPKKPVLLCGMLADKDVSETLRLLAPLAECAVCTAPNSERALPPQELAACFARFGVPAESFQSVPQAVQRANKLAGPDGCVVCFGSLYLAGEVRDLFYPPQP